MQTQIKLLLLGMFLSNVAAAQSPYDLAVRAAEVIGIGRNGACSSCHATSSKQTFARWSVAVQRVDSCLNVNNHRTARERLGCISEQTVTDQWAPSPQQLGFYSAGLHLSPIKENLLEVFGEQKTADILSILRDKVQMPLRSTRMLSADDFLAARKWFSQGTPFLGELIDPYDGPTTCESQLSPSLKEHLLQTEADGWHQQNQNRGLLMFACNPQGKDCFTQQRNGLDLFPDVKLLVDHAEWNPHPEFQMRKLYENTTSTEYWIRTSPDGRFLAYGGSPSGIIDLQASLQGRKRVIKVDAYYDPGFFPDDSGFVFQGRGTGMCNMSLLKNAATSRVTFHEEACSLNGQTEIPLYQSVGASLDGSDYLAATGEFMSDPGDGSGPVLELNAEPQLTADAESKLYLYPITYDGSRWIRKEAQSFDTPWEMDWSLAPSNRLLLSRIEGRVNDTLKHIGYKLYGLKRDHESAAYEKISYGQICGDGLKGNFSFDDRFMVTYSYIKPDQYRLLGYDSAQDPEFQRRLQAGTSNILLHDLWTQQVIVMTHSGPEQYALFPHFRSDGWMYFMVHDTHSQKHYFLASDAAIRLKQANPTGFSTSHSDIR